MNRDANSPAIFIPRGIGELQFVIPRGSGKLKPIPRFGRGWVAKFQSPGNGAGKNGRGPRGTGSSGSLWHP